MTGLTIDVGNTAIKFGVFYKGDVITFNREELTDIKAQINRYLSVKYNYIALCSVRPSIITQVKEAFPEIIIVDSSHFSNMIEMNLGNPPVKAPMPELGVDIAVGCYGGLTFGHENIIVVDSGTATTITAVVDNVISAVYIHPGFRISKQSLFGGTEALAGDYTLKVRSGMATDTESCIDLAVYHGLNGAVREIVKQIEYIFNRKFKLIITGGDTSDFYIRAYKKNDKLVNIGLDAYVRDKIIKTH